MAQGSLILVGESGLFREGLKRVLADGKLNVVGEAVSLSDALPLLRSLKPTVDLVVCDQPEGLAQPFDALKRVTREFPKTPVVILADQLDAAPVDKGVAAG